MPIARAAALAAVLMLSACGGDDKSNTAGTVDGSPTPAATARSAGLDDDALLAVHDTLFECLRKADVGTLVHFRDGEAAIGESQRQPKFETALAAPDATTKAVGEGVLYVGLRDDARVKGLTPDWDILIYPSEEAAAAATAPLSDEAGDPAAAAVHGRFVTVVLPDADANGDDPDAAEAKLAACQDEADAG
jgi:hypothetical protein